MEFFDVKTIAFLITFFGIIIIFTFVIFSRHKYFLLFNKVQFNKIIEEKKLLNKSLAGKERILDLYQYINSGKDSFSIKNTLNSHLKSLIGVKEIQIAYRLNGSENLQILSENNEGEHLVVPFKKFPSNSELKNNRISNIKYHDVNSDNSWMPENFSSCTLFPSFKNTNFMGVVCLFWDNEVNIELLSIEIKNLLNTSMKLIWYHSNYSTGDLMENILAESGRLNKIENNVVEIGSMKLDKDKSEVFIDGNYVDITNQEFNILELLVLKKDAFVTTEELLNDAWKKTNVSSAAVDIALFRLRQKLGKHKNGLNLIKNKTGKGYTLNAV